MDDDEELAKLLIDDKICNFLEINGINRRGRYLDARMKRNVDYLLKIISIAGGEIGNSSTAGHKFVPSLRSSCSIVLDHLRGLAVWL